MTISSTTSRVSFAGNGSTTVFSFPYYFLDDADLVVILRVDSTGVETTKTITTHYTVTGAGDDAGGEVTMLTAPASGETLIIYRDPSVIQETDLAENDSLPAETVEETFDRGVMIAQRLKNRLDRAVRLTEGYSSSFDPSLPTVMEAGDLLRVNSGATGFEAVAESELVTAQVKHGPTSISNGATSVAVSFTAAFTDTSYDISATLQNTTDASPDFQPVTITAKSTSGFTATWNSAVPTANYKLAWIAIRATA